MKKATVLLWFWIFLLLISNYALAALDRITLTSYKSEKEKAETIDVGAYYHTDYQASYYNRAWYKFVAEKDGEYLFLLENISAPNRSYISLYTGYDEELFETAGARAGNTTIEKIELEVGQTYYMCIWNDSSPMVRNKHQFTICGPDQHAGLGAEQVVKKATCSMEGISAQVCEFCDGWANEKPIPAKGHTPSEWQTSIDASCETAGLMVQRCSTCRNTLAKTAIPALGHQPGEMKVTLEATCRQPGIKSIQCLSCKTVLESEEIPLGEHVPGSMKTVVGATCLEDGRKEQRCSVCNFLMAKETEPATGHRNPQWKTLRDATCTAEGTRTQYCGICGETLNTEKIPLYGHSFGEWMHIEPACTKEGRNTQYCTVCGVEVNFEVLPANGHQYTEWETVKKATTKEEGQESCHCVRCGDTQMRTTEKRTFWEGLLGK